MDDGELGSEPAACPSPHAWVARTGYLAPAAVRVDTICLCIQAARIKTKHTFGLVGLFRDKTMEDGNLLEGRDDLAVLLDEDTVLEGVGGANDAGAVLGSHFSSCQVRDGCGETSDGVNRHEMGFVRRGTRGGRTQGRRARPKRRITPGNSGNGVRGGWGSSSGRRRYKHAMTSRVCCNNWNVGRIGRAHSMGLNRV